MMIANERSKPTPRLSEAARVYEISLRANVAEIESALATHAMKRHEPFELALRGIEASLHGDPQGCCTLLTRAIRTEKTAARAFFADLLVPVLVTRGNLEEAEDLIASLEAVPSSIEAAILAARAGIAAKLGQVEEAAALDREAHRAMTRVDSPLVLARVLQRLAFSAYYRGAGDDAKDFCLRSARICEREGAFRSAASAYAMLYVIAYAVVQDADAARFYAERITSCAERAGDESYVRYGRASLFHLAVESGDERRATTLRDTLLSDPIGEQAQEQYGVVLSESLMSGWAADFDRVELLLSKFAGGDSSVRGARAVAVALRAVAAVANNDLEEARRLARRAISLTARPAPCEAAHERRTRINARFLGSAACFLLGDGSRGARALTRDFDPSGRLRAGLSQDGVDPTAVPTLLRGYATFINAAAAMHRRRLPTVALTATEVDILRLLPTGATISQIARDRGRSRRTIDRQVESIYAKLGVHTRAEAIARARHLLHSRPLQVRDRETFAE